MSVGLPSDEVAEDYKKALEDLTLNSRIEISNLTLIAKETTEHALAISRVLENHIRNTPPDRKLPALYVLDSIVKNVGTPYTLFLGRNLYSIFMNAYTLLNHNVRRKLEEMLDTWEQPVPGSLDQRPVFPIETIRPIKNALHKARSAAAERSQQEQARTQQMIARQRPIVMPNTQWRSTPTPPQANTGFSPPLQQGYYQHNILNGQYQPRSSYPPQHQYPPPQHVPQPLQQSFQQPASFPHHPPAPQPLDSLIRDIAELVRTTQEQLAATVYDNGLKGRLTALLQLQDVMSRQLVTPNQVQAIRDQITALSVPLSRVPAPAPYAPPTQAFQQQQQQPQQPLPYHQRPTPVRELQTGGLQASLDSKNLADIIARAQRTPAIPPAPQVSLPQQPSISNSRSSMPPAQAPAPGLDLFAALRAQGLLPPGSVTPANDSNGYVPPSTTTHTPSTLSTGLAHPAMINDVELTSASLKRPRSHLISTLYEARPNQCSTCGRRFFATEEGRAQKARHLDWHFQTNSRLTASAQRGQSRSWYVDELEWIRSRDNPEDAPLAEVSPLTKKAALAASLAAADPKNKYIPVPSDPALERLPCPICQENFVTTYNKEVEDFVWQDAIRIRSRVYHASCHSEVKKDGGNTPGRLGTPDSVLGKRKALAAEIPDITANNAKAIKA